jgi:iron complex outermembrane recepter protein
MITTRRHDTLRRAITLALIAAASTGSLTASAAEPESLETIIVTGSNIRRADIETASPVQVVTREEIDRTGKTTVGEYLQTLTADGAGSVPKSFGTGFAAGAAGVSLRGLGAGSTLVLLNGRRIAPYGLADDGQKIFTDLSVIPLETVERVEVLKDGASAIYGSDAMAGVVNIILRPEVQGFKAKASYAASGENDGNTSKISLTGGFGDLSGDGYNVYFNVEGSQSDEITVRDRADRKWIGSGDIRPYGYSSTGSQFLVGFIDGNTISNSPTGGVLTPGTNVPVSLPGCAQFSEVPQTGSGGGCLWEAGRFRWLTPKQEYVNAFGKGTFALGEAFEATAELGYSRKKNEFNNTPSGVSGSWGYPAGPVNASSGPGATMIGANHPDNTVFPGQAVRVRYSAWDVGPRVGEQTNEFYRALFGVKGSIGEWDLELAALHSESDLLAERRGFLRYSAVRDALSGTGPIVWRIGDNANLNSQAVYDYISPDLHADGKNQMDLVDVKVSRGLFDLPGGEFGFAFGAEYRRLEASLTPQTFTDVGDIIGLGYSSFDGTENSIGTYVELLAPVLDSVELSAAVRYDSYMNSESATTPKFGVKWTPVEMLSLRGTYAEGFRIPNAAETGGIAAGFANARDPLRCPGGTPVPGASTADCNQSVAIVTRSNGPLKPEESESYTVGLVLSPLASTTLTIDAWQIKRTDEIRGETLVETIARGDVVRNDNILPGQPGTGQLLAANANYINGESTKVRGIDIALLQTVDIAAYGRLSFDLQWSRINSFVAIQSDGTEVEYAGTHGNCDVTNCIGTPKNRINLGATWSLDAFSVGAVVNYRGEMRNNDSEGESCTNTFADGSDAPRGCILKSFYSIGLTGRWDVTEAMQLFGTVENLTDRVAPLDPHTYGAVNYNPLDASGAIGRYFTLGLSYSF